jgi:hypothetical protein
MRGDNVPEKTTNLVWPATDEEKAAINEFQKMLGMSQREFLAFTGTLGMMVLELMAERPIDAQSFANALFDIGGRFLQAEYRRSVPQTVEGFRKWKALKEKELARTWKGTRRLETNVKR